MTYVVTQPCHDCKYTDCVAVCPVECFYQDDMMLYIDPNDCIDCEACVPECPVEAIFVEANVPAQWTSWTQVNADKSLYIQKTLKTLRSKLERLKARAKFRILISMVLCEQTKDGFRELVHAAKELDLPLGISIANDATGQARLSELW